MATRLQAVCDIGIKIEDLGSPPLRQPAQLPVIKNCVLGVRSVIRKKNAGGIKKRGTHSGGKNEQKDEECDSCYDIYLCRDNIQILLWEYLLACSLCRVCRWSFLPGLCFCSKSIIHGNKYTLECYSPVGVNQSMVDCKL